MQNKKDYLVKQRLQRIAELEGISRSDVVFMLADLYEFKDLNKLMELTSYHYKRGLNISQIRQLRILVSHIKTILDRIENI